MRVLGLGVSAAAVLFAACSGSTATQAPASAGSQPGGEPAGGSASAAASEAPSAAARRRPRRPRSGCSSSGRRRRSSPATSRRTSRATTRPRTSRSSSSTAARRSSRSRSARRRTAPSSRSRGSRRSSRRASAGSDLVDIAQVFQRSGTLSVSWKDSGIDDPCRLAGKKVGVWDFGNEFEVTAGLSLELRPDPRPREQRATRPRSTRRSSRPSTWSRS